MYSVTAVCQLPPYAPGLQKWLDTAPAFKGPMPQWGIGGPKQEHPGEERLFQEEMWEGMVCLGDHMKILVLLEEQVWEGR